MQNINIGFGPSREEDPAMWRRAGGEGGFREFNEIGAQCGVTSPAVARVARSVFAIKGPKVHACLAWHNGIHSPMKIAWEDTT